MARFSDSSKRHLATCDIRLQGLAKSAIRFVDFKVLVGHRTEEKQNEAFLDGVSKLEWPDSRHNAMPSKAFDLAPYPIKWDSTIVNLGRFYFLAGVIMALAELEGIKIRWGGDWDRDQDFSDQSFNDLVHFELVE